MLLPGSAADVDPQKYNAERSPQTADADALRDAVDELLLQDAHNLRKPIFGICYGLQSLNVWRTGTLVQDIASVLRSPVKHEAGRAIARAHSVHIDPISNLAGIFQFGTGSRFGSSADFLLFHSRRIGLSANREEIPILGGLKLTGKAGRFDIGLINMQTDHQGEQPGQNFTVARVKTNVLGRSYVGGIQGIPPPWRIVRPKRYGGTVVHLIASE